MPTAGRRHGWLSLNSSGMRSRDPAMPVNSGVFHPLTVSLPEGSILNPVFPAAVGVRHAVGSRMIDVVGGLLAQAVPDFMRTAGCGVLIPVVLAEPPDPTGKRKVDVVEPVTGGSGGGPGLDGVDARDNSSGGMANNPLETVEAAAGLTVKRYGIRPDSGGPGKWRGGVGVELTFEPHRKEAWFLAEDGDFRFAPWGLLGGKCGANARAIKNTVVPMNRILARLMVEIGPGGPSC